MNDILLDAQAAKQKVRIEDHRDAILLLRQKGYTWREIASFLGERGVEVDHTRVFRLITKSQEEAVTIPSAAEYQKALTAIPISDKQRLMLQAHYQRNNRSITYTDLALAAGYADHAVANRQYGQLGRDLGEAVGFSFVDAANRPGEKFFSSAIGMPNSFGRGDFQLVMHHELAKAIRRLGWFDSHTD